MAERPAIEVRGVGRRFGRRAALVDVSLEVRPGEIVAVAGANGSGKTTLLRILAGLVERDSGSAALLGVDPREGPERLLREARFSFAPPALLDGLTAREHVARVPALAGTRVDRSAAIAALESVGLAERADEPVACYSFGMRQRLALALALLPRPRVLVLDEPSEGLDPRAVMELRQLLRELAREGLAILFASHLLHEVERVADSVVLLDQGRVVASGATAALVGRARGVRIETSGADEALVEHYGEPLERAGGRTSFRLEGEPRLEQVAHNVRSLGGSLEAFHPERPTLEAALLERLVGR